MLLLPNAASSRNSAKVLETGKCSLVKCRPGTTRVGFLFCKDQSCGVGGANGLERRL